MASLPGKGALAEMEGDHRSHQRRILVIGHHRRRLNDGHAAVNPRAKRRLIDADETDDKQLALPGHTDAQVRNEACGMQIRFVATDSLYLFNFEGSVKAQKSKTLFAIDSHSHPDKNNFGCDIGCNIKERIR